MATFQSLPEAEVLANPELLDRVWECGASFAFVPDKTGIRSDWLSQAVPEVPPAFASSHFCLLTSGSTGEPKLIVGEKSRSEELAVVLHRQQSSDAVAETICALPLSYSYAFINQWLWSHVHGRKLRLTRGFSEPDTLRSALESAESAMLCLVGSQVSLLRRYFPDLVFPGIIRLHFAGGRFPQEHLEFLRERFPNAQIFNNYGCAEAMPRLTLRRAEDAAEAAHVGRPLPGVELRSNAEKRLLFRSPYRAVALVDDGGFRLIADDEWLPTGDLGEPVGDGSWRLLGRANEVFKRHGEKISLASLLTSVRSSWGGETAFYREPDPQGEESCILVLSPQPDEHQLREILLAFRKHYTRPHWPIRIESMEQLPLLPNGKPDLVALKTAPDKQLHWRQRI